MNVSDMSMDEVIQYCIETSNCKNQRTEYRQLAKQIAGWLQELKERREADTRECERNVTELEAKLIIANMNASNCAGLQSSGLHCGLQF